MQLHYQDTLAVKKCESTQNLFDNYSFSPHISVFMENADKFAYIYGVYAEMGSRAIIGNIVTTFEKHKLYESANDGTLLQGLKDSDREAFAVIYERYHTMMYTLALKFLKSRADVEDILQSVFVKLWISRSAIFISTNLRGYLFAMTRNAVMNHIRNSNTAVRHNYGIAQQQPDYDDDLYTYAERNNASEVLHTVIESLPPQQKMVAKMRCEGFSNAEIAKLRHLSIHTVNSHYRACVKALKGRLSNMPEALVIILLTILFSR